MASEYIEHLVDNRLKWADRQSNGRRDASGKVLVRHACTHFFGVSTLKDTGVALAEITSTPSIICTRAFSPSGQSGTIGSTSTAKTENGFLGGGWVFSSAGSSWWGTVYLVWKFGFDSSKQSSRSTRYTVPIDGCRAGAHLYSDPILPMYNSLR